MAPKDSPPPNTGVGRPPGIITGASVVLNREAGRLEPNRGVELLAGAEVAVVEATVAAGDVTVVADGVEAG